MPNMIAVAKGRRAVQSRARPSISGPSRSPAGTASVIATRVTNATPTGSTNHCAAVAGDPVLDSSPATYPSAPTALPRVDAIRLVPTNCAKWRRSNAGGCASPGFAWSWRSMTGMG